MARLTRPLLLCGAVLLAAACTRVVGGAAVPGFGPAAKGVHGVNVDTILLDQSRMRAITGAGDHLTIIPSMDGNRPVDIDALADTTPRECRFLYAETATFGPDIEEFHKTTFQDPPDGRADLRGRRGLSGRRHRAARLRRPGGHRGGLCGWFDRPVARRRLARDAEFAAPGPGGCGRDYRVLSVALLEVTICGFPQSVSDIVMTNIVANIPG